MAEKQNITGLNALRLRNLLKSSVKIENAPDTIDTTFILDELINKGFIVFCNVGDELRALNGALSGVSCYSQPTDFQIANPVIQSDKIYKVGVDAVPVYATRERRKALNTLNSIIGMYAARLNKIDISIDRAIINTRQVRVFTADTPAAYKNVQRVIQAEQNADTSATVVQSDLLANMQAYFPQIKNQYVLDMLLRDKRAIISDFLIQFGIDALPYEKKERMLTDEVDGNADEVVICRNGFAGWIDEQLQQVNNIFGTTLKCSYVPVLNIPTIEPAAKEVIDDVGNNPDNISETNAGNAD